MSSETVPDEPSLISHPGYSISNTSQKSRSASAAAVASTRTGDWEPSKNMISSNAPLLAPDGDAYTLYASSRIAASAADIMDGLLRQNPHYDYCRTLGQLGPLRIFEIQDKAFEKYLERQRAQGQRLGDIKQVALSRLQGWAEFFKGRYIGSDAE